LQQLINERKAQHVQTTAQMKARISSAADRYREAAAQQERLRMQMQAVKYLILFV